MKNVFFVSMVLALFMTACSTEGERVEDQLDQPESFELSLQKVILDNGTSVDLKSFDLSENESGLLSLTEVSTQETPEELRKIVQNTTDFLEVSFESGDELRSSVRVCCSGTGLTRCVVCSGGNIGNCITSALKDCSESGGCGRVCNKRMIYNPAKDLFLIYTPE